MWGLGLVFFFALKQEVCKSFYKPRRDLVAVLAGSKISTSIDIYMDVKLCRRLL